MKLITQGTSPTIQDILSRNGEKINVNILLITVPKPRGGWHLASTAFSCLVPLSMNQPKGQISTKACVYMNVSHNKHISLESRNIYKQKHLVIIKFLKSEMDLYSMLYVVKKKYNIQEYVSHWNILFIFLSKKWIFSTS